MDNSNKIILEPCGGSGSWGNPYVEAGYDVRIITLPEYDVTKVYFQDTYMVFVDQKDIAAYKNIVIEYSKIYGILAAPPCTQFSRARTTANTKRNLEEGMLAVRACMEIIWKVQERATDDRGLPLLKFWALENPMGSLRRFLGRPEFNFNPCDFGDPWTKQTDLWGWFNKPTKKPCVINENQKSLLKDNNRKMPRLENGVYRDRRAITPPGFAQAFFKANQ
jgi:hypothetical protein